ncbi:ubiquitin-specific protease ubp2 [Exophiala oligosperma]
MLETSEGRFDVETLNAAYKAFHLTGREGVVNDDDIIGAFTATLADAAPSQQHELREYLRMIGVHRNSKKIADAAQNVINNYEQALVFLGADQTTEDAHIQALFTVKIAENSDLQPQAIQAVRLIAEHRNSQFLSHLVETGFVQETHQMEPAEGYQALQIENREVDDEMILLQYDMAVEENPGSVEYYTKALAAIASGRKSDVLLNHLHSKAPQAPEGTQDEPVGLENIGNTCYLNSLLQALFTLITFRHVVLDFDEYKMSLEPKNMESKRVGQRKVSLKEVQTAQKFVEQLGYLFRGMIETPQSSIKPEQELARLTLETESVKERMRRRSTLMSERPSLGHIDSLPMLGPPTLAEFKQSGMPDDALVQSPTEDVLFNPLVEFGASRVELRDDTNKQEEDTKMDDNSSEATLVSKPDTDLLRAENTTEVEQQSILDNKENLSPVKEIPVAQATSTQTAEPLAPASPSKLNVQAGALAQPAAPADKGTEQDKVEYEPPPGKPPPVPPRKPAHTATTTLEEYARQQDVTEVMNHCIIQLSCAIRPTGFDQSGEQIDEIHDLFFGQQIIHTQPEKEKPQPLPFLNIITRVYHQPADVYAAIDNEYDLQDAQDGTKAYTSVTRLPPVLSVALDRVSWNQEARRQEKLNHHVEVPETIYMDRYVESDAISDLMQRRQQTWEMKRELATLAARRSILEEKQGQSKDVPSVLEDAKLVLEYLSTLPADPISEELNINPNITSTLGHLAEQARSELEGIRSRMDHLNQQVKEAFVDMRKHPYRLHAAFFHRGGAAGGHYWVYIFDHKKEMWRKYNDDRVTTVLNRNEIFGKPAQDNWGPPPNPYLLIYIRADRIDDLAETVKRDIVYPPPDEAPPPVPARSQMSEVPPNWSSQQQTSQGGDVEMLEYADGGSGGGNAGEQAQNNSTPEDEPYPYESDISRPPPQQAKESSKGLWDDSELMPNRTIKW